MKSKDGTKVSRRHFLEAAVVTAAAQSVHAASAGSTDTEAAKPVLQTEADAKRFEAIVSKYGSELGDLRKVT